MRLRRSSLLAISISSLLVATFASGIYRGEKNVLLKYPEWLSEKANLGLGVMGAQSFLAAPNSLAGRALNLGAWHGFQSLVLDKVFPNFPKVSFRAKAVEPGYVMVEARSGPERLAFRLSNDADRPSALLKLDAKGNFLEKKEIDFLLPTEEFTDFELIVNRGWLQLSESGRPISKIAYADLKPVTFAFRGSGSPNSVIDELYFDLEMDSYEQNFSGRFPWLFFLALAAASFVLLALMHFFAGYNLTLMVAWLLPLGAAGLLFFYDQGLASLYPPDIDLSGMPNRIESAAELKNRLEKFSPVNGKKTILWLGGSQAWGAGASEVGESTFSRLSSSASKCQWVKGAVSGARVADQLEPLRIISQRGPIEAVVLVAGVNDSPNPNFPRDLQAFVEEAKKVSRRIYLVVEPTALKGNAEIERAQAVVRSFPATATVKIFDLESAFVARGDVALDWWDFVHLSDVGQAFAAKEVERNISACPGN